MKKQTYKVLVYGVELYDSDDVLIADAVAHNYKTIGWKDIRVVGPGYNRQF
jgi:hypothetical protein